MYCGPTTANIVLGYLANQGFTQILPAGATFDDYLNLERILVGLSDTSFTGGAYSDNVLTAITMYLNARGIQNVTIQAPNAPDLTFFQTAQADVYTATFLNLQWLEISSDGTSYDDVGGHFVAVSGVNVTSPSQLVLSNPMPSSLFNVADLPQNNPQYADVIPFTADSPLGNGPFLQFDYNQPGSALSNEPNGYLAVIAAGFSVTLDPADLPGGAWTPATWTLTEATNQFTFNDATLEVIAPLSGTVGIEKAGTGTVLLRGANELTGDNLFRGGIVRSTHAGTTPFGTGSIHLESASLELTPDDSDTSPLTQTLADAFEKGLSYSGGSRMLVDRGNRTSLTVQIGDGSRLRTENFQRLGSGTFVLQVITGLADLGAATQVHLNGSGNLVEMNGMLAPHVIGADADGTGSFLTYGVSGFVTASYTSSEAVGVNEATFSTVYDVVDNQTVAADGVAAVHALRVASGRSVTGANEATELQVGGQSSGDEGGIILNHGATIDVGTLQFGLGNALIYTAGSDNAIRSDIVADQLTKFGNGDLRLSGDNQISGLFVVQSGTVHLDGGNPTGLAAVELGAGALVVGEGVTVGGTITSVGGHVILDGGTTGTVVTDINSTLSGHGVIEGDAYLEGALAPGLNEVIFRGKVTLGGNSMLVFTLGGLVDNETGTAGVDWTLYTFDLEEDESLSLLGFSFENDFDAFADKLPNSGDEFWNSNHSWLLMQSTRAFNENNFSSIWGFPAYEQGYFQWYWETAEGHYGHTLVMHYFAYAVPEPGSAVLLTAALMVLAGTRSRKRAR